jgi:hypothetical protein
MTTEWTDPANDRLGISDDRVVHKSWETGYS